MTNKELFLANKLRNLHNTLTKIFTPGIVSNDLIQAAVMIEKLSDENKRIKSICARLQRCTEEDWDALLHTLHRGFMKRWISVEHRLPDRDTRVLVYAQGKGDGFEGEDVIVITSYTDHMHGYNISGWIEPWQYFSASYEITHWMPLPEAPQKKESDV